MIVTDRLSDSLYYQLWLGWVDSGNFEKIAKSASVQLPEK